MKIKVKITVLFVILFSKLIFASEHPSGEIMLIYEDAWKNKNLESKFSEKSKKYLEKDQKVFIYFNYPQFASIKEEFFNGVNEEKSEGLGKWLDEKARCLDSTWSRFDDSLSVYSLKFESVMAITSTATVCTNCNNIGFENTINDECWTLKKGNSSSAYLTTPCNDLSCFGFGGTTLGDHIYLTGSGTYAPNTDNLLPEKCPWGGSHSIKLENSTNGGNASLLERTIEIPSSDYMFKFSYAVVLEDPGKEHSDTQKPFFMVRMYATDGTIFQEISCAKYVVIANPETDLAKEGFIKTPSLDHIYFKPWSTVVIPFKKYYDLGLHSLKVEFIASDCSLGGHFGYAYIDADCINPDLSFGSCFAYEQSVSISPYSSDADVKKDFKGFWWTGPGIVGPNYTPSIKVNKPGTYNCLLTTRTGCQTTLSKNNVTTCTPPVAPCVISSITASVGACSSSTNLFTLGISIAYSTTPTSGVMIISDGNISNIYSYPFPTSTVNFTNLLSDGRLHKITVTIYNDNFFSSDNVMCTSEITYTAPTACETMSAFECTDCLPSFSPEPGVYIVSAWVKQTNASPDAETFADPYIEISFSSGATVLSKLRSKGKIIDGWQRIYAEITIPSGQSNIGVKLGTDGTADVLFDDIRIHPVQSGFVSYVYDPVTLKLLATLDDNNYATIYEYDQEGTLTRVKKETERGIVTIKETRQNSPKR